MMLGAAGTAGRWPGGDRSFAARVPGAAWRGRALAACCLETKMRQPDTAAQPAQGCWLPGLAAGGGAVQPPWLRNGVNKPAGPRHHHQPSQGWRVSPRIFPSSDHRRPSPGQMGHKQEFLGMLTVDLSYKAFHPPSRVQVKTKFNNESICVDKYLF